MNVWGICVTEACQPTLVKDSLISISHAHIYRRTHSHLNANNFAIENSVCISNALTQPAQHIYTHICTRHTQAYSTQLFTFSRIEIFFSPSLRLFERFTLNADVTAFTTALMAESSFEYIFDDTDCCNYNNAVDDRICL